ncbi:hypothetical protein E4T56_gene7670 [Termitomyces sp. T112]|nr:hypothetical protein E4T56_gene7670 [Termitomyces sp. T112]
MKETPTPRRNNPRDEPQSISAEVSHSPTDPCTAPAKEASTNTTPTALQTLGSVRNMDSTPTSTPACFTYLTLMQIEVSLHTPRNNEEALESTKNMIQGRTGQQNQRQQEAGPDYPLTLPLEPLPLPPPNQSPSGPTPLPRPLPTLARPPLHPPLLSTTTPGPLHYAADAPPATSPPLPSPAATPEADPQTSAPTHLGSMQTLRRHHPREPGAPTPSLTPKTTHFSTRWRIGKDTYEGSPHAPKQPHWPANPPSTSLPPTLPTVNHPPAPFPAPPPPPWTAPPAASDAPASPVPLALAPLPLAPRCSMPAPMPPSLPMLHLDPPSPSKAPPPMPSTLPLEPRKTSMIKGGGSRELDAHPKGMPGVGE